MDESGLPLLMDQRGALRTADGNRNGTTCCDIGAVEVQDTLYLSLIRR